MKVLKASFTALLGLAWLAMAAAGDDIAKKRERAHSHLLEARRLAADYKISKAAEKCREALTDDPSLAEAHVYLGMERFRANDLQEAQAELNRALELDPYMAAAHGQLGYVLYQRGQLEDATDHWTLAVRLDSTLPQNLAGLALSQFRHGQEDEAARTLDKALMYDHRFSDPKFLQGENGPKWSGALLQDFQQMLAKTGHPGRQGALVEPRSPRLRENGWVQREIRFGLCCNRLVDFAPGGALPLI